MRRLTKRWLSLSAPHSRLFGTSIEEQERLRHSRLLSAILFCGLVAILLAIPTAIPVPTYWVPVLLNLSLSVVALLLNRSGKVDVAGIFYIIAIDVTFIVLLVTLPTGIRNSNIPDFDLFFIPVLISGVILSRRFIPFIAVAHIITIVALFSFLPHDRLLTQEIQVNQQGFAYSELSDAFILQVVGAAISWLSAWSVDRALLRANQAEELAAARQRINEQTAQIVEQKQRLEYGIDVVKNAQARFANGDFKARAKLQNNELVPLAMSFNLLAERLNRITQTAQEYTRLEQALQQLLDVQNAAFHGRAIKSYQPSGTLADRLQPILQRHYNLSNSIVESGPAFEKIRVELARQKTLVSELFSGLHEVRSCALALPGYNDTRSMPPSTLQHKSLADPSLSIARTEKAASRFDVQMQLIDRVQELCTQINKQNQQIAQEVKGIAQSLKVL
ncbi:MAG: hypothetical protein JO011_02975 [Ktedonobacteraceae bacterium]|nr:hypothetical protein [Ktedonobacteraceae bacterium]